MKNPVVFFEIPAADFGRAVKFYESVLGVKLEVADCEHEKIACFPGNGGAVSRAEGFRPGSDGVLIHLHTDNMESSLAKVVELGGSVTRPKTKIEVGGLGWFSTVIDSEGNQVGLYSEA